MNTKMRISVIILLALILIGGIGLVRLEKIDAGYVGIKVNLVGDNRGVDDITEVTGWVIYMPLLTAVYEFPTYTQVKDYDPFKIHARDGSEFEVDPTFSYYVDSNHVPQIFRQYRRTLSEIEDGYLRNVLFDSYRIVASSYASDSLISNRPEFEDKVQRLLQDQLSKEGFMYQQLTSSLKAPTSLMNAIEEKNRTTQEAIQAENRLRKAEAEAKARIIEAEAEKKVNDLKASALTPLIIQQMFIEKWDGKLPVYGETPKLWRDISKN